MTTDPLVVFTPSGKKKNNRNTQPPVAPGSDAHPHQGSAAAPSPEAPHGDEGEGDEVPPPLPAEAHKGAMAA